MIILVFLRIELGFLFNAFQPAGRVLYYEMSGYAQSDFVISAFRNLWLCVVLALPTICIRDSFVIRHVALLGVLLVGKTNGGNAC